MKNKNNSFVIPHPEEDLIGWSNYFLECIRTNKNIKKMCEYCKELVDVLFASGFVTKDSISSFFNNNLRLIIEAMLQKSNVSNRDYDSIFKSFLDLYYHMLCGEYYTQSKYILMILDNSTTYNSHNQESYQENVQYFVNDSFVSIISYIFNCFDDNINEVYSSFFTLLNNIAIFITEEQNELVFNLCMTVIEKLPYFDEYCLLDFIKFAKDPTYAQILHLFANRLYECADDSSIDPNDYINCFKELIDFGIDFLDTELWKQLGTRKFRRKFKENMIPYLAKISNKISNEKLTNILNGFDDKTRKIILTSIMNNLGTFNSEEMANQIKFIFQLSPNPNNIPWEEISKLYENNIKAFDNDVCKLILSKIKTIEKPFETDAILIISQLISNVACDLQKRKELAEDFHQFKVISENIEITKDDIDTLVSSYRVSYDKQAIITKLMDEFIENKNSYRIREKILKLITAIFSDGSKYGESTSTELEVDKSSFSVNVQSDFGFNELEIFKNWKINDLYSYFSVLEGLSVEDFELYYDDNLIKGQSKVSDLKIDKNKYLLIKFTKINTVPKIPVTATLLKRTSSITKVVSVPSSASINDLIQILKVTFKINGIYSFTLNDKNIKTKKTVQELSMNKNDVICISQQEDDDESYLTIEFIKELMKSKLSNHKILSISPPPKELIEQMNDMAAFVKTLSDEDNENYIDYVLSLIIERKILNQFLDKGGYNLIVDSIIDGLNITNHMITCIDNQFDVSENLEQFVHSLFESNYKNIDKSVKILEILFRKSGNNEKSLLPESDVFLGFMERTSERSRTNLILIISKIPCEFKVLMNYYRENPEYFAKYFEIFMNNDDISQDDLISYMKSSKSNKEKVLDILVKNKSVNRKYYDDIYSVFNMVKDTYQLKILTILDKYKLSPENLENLIQEIEKVDLKVNLNCQYSVGIRNMGSTCYANSSLQQLFYCKPFRDFVLNADFENSEENKEVQKIFNLLQSKEEPNISLERYNDICTLFPDEQLNTRQQDASEFIICLIDRIKNSDKIFNFQDISLLIHKVTGEEISRPQQNQLMLDLPVKDFKNFEQSISSIFIQEEHSQYEYHNEKITVVQKRVLKNLPNNLIVHLKRFEYSDDYNIRKVKSKFEFPLEFNSNILDKDSNKNYKLHGVICHTGIAEAGHYISIIRTNDLGYVRLDDTAVTQMTEEEFRETTIGGGDDEFLCFTAYILFYSVDDLLDIATENVFMTNEFYDFVMYQNDPILALTYCIKCFLRKSSNEKHCDEIFELIKKGDESEICQSIHQLHKELIYVINNSGNERILDLAFKLLEIVLKLDDDYDRNYIFNTIVKEINTKNVNHVNRYCELVLNYLKEHIDEVRNRNLLYNQFAAVKNELKNQKGFDLSFLKELCKLTFVIDSEEKAEEFINSVEDYDQLADISTDIFMKYFDIMCYDLLFKFKQREIGKKILSRLTDERSKETINIFFNELFLETDRHKLKTYDPKTKENCYLADYLLIFMKSFENSKNLRSQLNFQRILRLCYIYNDMNDEPPVKYNGHAKLAQSLLQTLLLFEPNLWKENEINYDDPDEGLQTLKIEPIEMTKTILKYIIDNNDFAANVFKYIIKSAIKGNKKLIDILIENSAYVIQIIRLPNNDVDPLLNDLLLQEFDNEEIDELLIPIILKFYFMKQKQAFIDYFLDKATHQRKEKLLNVVATKSKNANAFSKIFPLIDEILEDKNISFINYFVNFGDKYKESFSEYRETFSRIKEELESDTNINYDKLLLTLLKVFSKKFENEKGFFKIGEIFLIVLKKNYFDENVKYKQTAAFLENIKKSKLAIYLLSSLVPLMNRSFEKIRFQEVKDKAMLIQIICDILQNQDEIGNNLEDLAYKDELISILLVCDLIKENPAYKKYFSLKQEQLSEKTRTNQTVIDVLFTE